MLSKTEEEETLCNVFYEASMTLILNLTQTFLKKKIKTPVMSNCPPNLVSFLHYQQADKLPWIGGRGGKSRLAGWWATISNFCTAPNWTWKIMQSNLTFFRFLKDLDRSQKWVKKCKICDLEDKTPDLLSKHYCQML